MRGESTALRACGGLWRRHDLQTLKGRLLQLLAVVRVRNADQFVRALTNALAEQVRHAELRHDVVNVSARRRHAST